MLSAWRPVENNSPRLQESQEHSGLHTLMYDIFFYIEDTTPFLNVLDFCHCLFCWPKTCGLEQFLKPLFPGYSCIFQRNGLFPSLLCLESE